MTSAAPTATTTQLYRVWIKATPEAIWDAITRPEFTARYFYGARIENTAERHRLEAIHQLKKILEEKNDGNDE